MASLLRSLALLAGLGGLLLLTACMTPAINDQARVGPFYRPTNVAADPTLGAIRRVVLLPAWGGAAVPEETAVALDPVFRRALQDQNRFEIVTLTREECLRRFGVTSLASTAALPHGFLETLQHTFAADAVMFIDLTVYHPYTPLALGIRAKLATINGARLVWAFDNVFSADDPQVAAAARHFFLNDANQGVPGDLTPAVLQSPSRFGTYAAHTAFATLPPVTLGRFTQSSSDAN